MPDRPERPRFTLQEASALLPAVKRLTDEAVRQVEPILQQLDGLEGSDPEYARLSASLDEVIGQWASEVGSLGAEVKGLWLVDFDNGEGYYCWRHPEPAITHFHGYDEGFAGRMTIV